MKISIQKLAQQHGLKYMTLYARLKIYGWPVKKALSVPTLEQHGFAVKQTSEYNAWRDMKARCYNSKNKYYNRYGGRGICVCKKWRYSFKEFLKDMGEKPSTIHSIDRINNDGNYEPENCRWATPKQQSNNSSNQRLITYNGKTKNITQWNKILGFNRGVLDSRLNKGWSVEKAFETYVRKRQIKSNKLL